jgi:ribosomal protein S18 acetylase RimI-like enzyme
MVHIREATPGEYAAVGELTEAAYRSDGHLQHGDGYAAVLLDAAGRARSAELLVAVGDGKLVGTVTYCPPGSGSRQVAKDGEAEFRMLAVAEDWHGRGVARALVTACEERARSHGISRLVLCTLDSMQGAQALYRSMGFVRVPDRDWEPVPEVWLRGFSLVL